ncbi:MAG TPA: response regulator, partial [Anaerovoracaceae bacterium]|nr:response regulator [Anaerovoracaceae bacterium]
MTHSVLIIDDARSVISVAKNVIPAYPELYPVVEAKNSIVGLELLNNLRAELVILKYDMPFLNGHEFLRKVLSMGVRTQYILIFSEDLENEFPSLALRNDISSILFEKDLTFDTLHEAIRKAIADMKKTKDLYQNVQKYEDLLQDSPQMIQSDRQTVFSEMISGIYSGEERLKRIFHDENLAVFWLVLVEVSQDTDSGFTFYLHLESIKALQEKMRKQANLYQGVDIFIVHDQKLCMVIEPGSPAAAAAHTGNLEPILQDFSKLARWLSLPSFVFTFFDQPVALSQLAQAYKSISDFSKYR